MTAERMPDHVAYRVVRQHVTELALATAGSAGTVVPACPEWTVLDLVAHVAGNCAAAVRKRVPGNGAGSADADPGDLVPAGTGPGDPAPADPADGLAAELARWDRAGRRLDQLAAGADLRLGPLLMDAFTHELDLCAALGVAAPAEHPAYPAALEVVIGGLGWSIDSHGL